MFRARDAEQLATELWAMAWGNSWSMDRKEILIIENGELTEYGKSIHEKLLKQSETHTYHYLGDQEPLKYLGTVELTDNLIFICDTCNAIFDPGISGFQALIDAAMQVNWRIKFHVLKEGYSTWCPKCVGNSES